jgi:hypothetical protein
MTMMHHDSRDYAVAVSESKTHFQQKLEQMVHSAKPRVNAVIEQVQNDQPEDMIVAGRKLRFNPTTDGISIELPENEKVLAPLSIHEHAFYQVAERTGFKHAAPFLRDLKTSGYNEQVADILTARYAKGNGDRYLLRAVRGEVRGFLSDSYRRLDSRPLLEAFVGAIARYGAKPLDGFALQTKMSVRAVLPRVFEPIPGEIMAFGAQLSDSDFGDGALSVSGFVMRMICTNLATTEDMLRQIHLGKRLTDNVTFSQKTLQLDTEAMASAIDDVAQHVLGTKAINNYLNLVKKANDEKIEPDQITKWAKAQLTKGETVKAVEKFSSPDIELLPAGQTKWRWSNALSWLANETEDEHRRLELQEFAGSILK